MRYPAATADRLRFTVAVAAALAAAATAHAFAPWPLPADPRWTALCGAAFGAAYGAALARLIAEPQPRVPLSIAGALVAAALYAPGSLLAGVLVDAYGPLALDWPTQPVVLAGVAGGLATAALTALAGRGDQAGALGAAALLSFGLGQACDLSLRAALIALRPDIAALAITPLPLHIVATACSGLIAGLGVAGAWRARTDGASAQLHTT